MRKSKHTYAKGMPIGQGTFVGEFSLPGIGRQRVRKDGNVCTFLTAEEARSKAALALVKQLQYRTGNTNREGDYERIAPEELAGAIGAVGLDCAGFARIYGVPESRVVKWTRGEQDIPHAARVVIEMLAFQDAMQAAVDATNAALSCSSARVA